jgi:hypothetical protein
MPDLMDTSWQIGSGRRRTGRFLLRRIPSRRRPEPFTIGVGGGLAAGQFG